MWVVGSRGWGDGRWYGQGVGVVGVKGIGVVHQRGSGGGVKGIGVVHQRGSGDGGQKGGEVKSGGCRGQGVG